MADSETILIVCPECQASYELPLAEAGQQVECVCGCQFVVPESVCKDSVPVRCPFCSAVYEVEADRLGEQVECECGMVFEATDSALPEGALPSVQEETIRTICPSCSAEYELEAEAVGQEVECACGVRFVVSLADSPSESDFAASNVEETKAEPSAPPGPGEGESWGGAERASDEIDGLVAAAVRDDAVSDRVARSTPASSAKSKPDKARRRTRDASRHRQMPVRLLILGGCAVAAMVGLLVFLFSNGDKQAKSPKAPGTAAVDTRESKQKEDISRQTVAAVGRKASRSTAGTANSEERRLSLAERLEQFRRERNKKAASVTKTISSQKADIASEKASDSMTSVNSPDDLSENPNELTNRQDFVIGGKFTGKKPVESPPPSRPGKRRSSPQDRSSAAASSVTSKTDSTDSASASNDGSSATRSATVPLPQKRIKFIPPNHRHTRFQDAVAAAFKAFASMRAKQASAQSGSEMDTDDWETELASTGGLLESALELMDDESDPKLVLQTRLMLAYCYLEAGHVYEAGILAHALARWTPPDLVIKPETKKETKPEQGKPKQVASQPKTAGEAILAAENNAAAVARRAGKADVDPGVPMRPAREAATLALAAWVQAYDAASKDDRIAEFNQITEVATLFESNFPDYEKIDSIRLYVGQLHENQDDQVGAADWYARVSKTSPEFARSRLQAGQALWSSYLAAVQQETGDGTRKTVAAGEEPLIPAQLRKRAQQYLTVGVNAGADNAALQKNVIVAKLTLAQLHLGEDRFDKAIAALTTGQPSVISVIGEGGEGRPAIGIRSVEFAKLAYTALIRAYLGASQLDEASSAMVTLQGIVGTDDSASLAKLNLELSAEMAAAYKKMAAKGQEDIELLTTIAASLEQVAAHQAGLSLSGLMKAASVASDLADSVSVPEDAQLIYGQAVSFYQTMLKTELPDPDSEKAIRFRLAAAFGKACRFDESLRLYHELLAEQPNIFDAQFAAAKVMQAWGENVKEPNRLVRAISGDPHTPSIWGWAKLSSIYQRLMAKDESRVEYRDRFLETRLHIAECRLAYARQLSSRKKNAELEKALRELGALARTSGSYDGPVWPLLDAISQTIQKELGHHPEPLIPLAETRDGQK